LSEGIVIIIGSIFAGIIYIGIGQAVDFLARTAFSTDRACTIMETSMLRLSKSIEIALASTKPSAQKKNIPPPPPTSSPRPPAVYHFVLDDTDQGPFTHIDMQDFRSAGVIADDTPVFRDGETEWRTYRDFQELTAA
jgi:GYF domain 2